MKAKRPGVRSLSDHFRDLAARRVRPRTVLDGPYKLKVGHPIGWGRQQLARLLSDYRSLTEAGLKREFALDLLARRAYKRSEATIRKQLQIAVLVVDKEVPLAAARLQIKGAIKKG